MQDWHTGLQPGWLGAETSAGHPKAVAVRVPGWQRGAGGDKHGTHSSPGRMKQGQALALYPLQRPVPLPAWCGDTGGHRAGGGCGPLLHVCCPGRAHSPGADPSARVWQSWPGAHLGWCQVSCQHPLLPRTGCSPGTSTAGLNFVQLQP